MSKRDKLKPRLLECVDRLRKLIELDAPVVVVGAAAYSVFATTLATYGDLAASTFIQHIRDENLHNRGVCSHGDCAEYVERPDVGICKSCLKELGIPEDAQWTEPGSEEVPTA